MKIDRLSFSLHRFPPATPWQDATHRVTGLEFIIARLETDAGIRGIGFTYTVGVGGSAILALLEDYCVNVVMGHDIREPERLWKHLFSHLHRTGSGGINTLAIAAIDTAVWDALSRSWNLPLWRALGGAQESIPGYGSGIDLFMSPKELTAHIDGYLRQGYQAVKIKVGLPDLDGDIARLRAVRELIGPNTRLLLDANQCWTVDEAVRRARAFEVFQPSWLEEPLAPEDIAGHARLRGATAIPIAIGESLYTAPQFLDYLRAGAVDILQPDVARVGGFTPWKKIAALAEAWNLLVAPHFLAELSLHALCAVPNGLILENVTGGSFAELGLTTMPMKLDGGRFHAPSAPGHGLELNEDTLERFRIQPGDLRNQDTSTHL
ncbi:MAG: mandelate racemase/muconate lactonizing enzyme family protein [Methylacidiphilales bacterium]|nr:mandelate racemase/muconate lactonizing enzyme family protein [Candidatus Methylacidiphilales bacterium]